MLRTYRRAAMWRRKAESEGQQRFWQQLYSTMSKNMPRRSQDKRRWSKMGPRQAKIGPRQAKTGTDMFPDRPKPGPRQAKAGQDRPKTGPRQAQEKPRQAQDSLLTVPAWPRQSQDRPRQTPRADLERFCRFRSRSKPWFFLRVPPTSAILSRKRGKCEKWVNIMPTWPQHERGSPWIWAVLASPNQGKTVC